MVEPHKDGSMTLDNRSVQRLMDYGLLHFTEEGWHVGKWPVTNTPTADQDKPFNPLVDKLTEQELDEVEACMTGRRTDQDKRGHDALICFGGFGYKHRRQRHDAFAKAALLPCDGFAQPLAISTLLRERDAALAILDNTELPEIVRVFDARAALAK